MMGAPATTAPEGLSVAALPANRRFAEITFVDSSVLTQRAMPERRNALFKQFAEANFLNSAVHPREPPEPVNFPCSRPAWARHLRMHSEHCAGEAHAPQLETASRLCENCGGQVFLVDRLGKPGRRPKCDFSPAAFAPAGEPWSPRLPSLSLRPAFSSRKTAARYVQCAPSPTINQDKVLE